MPPFNQSPTSSPQANIEKEKFNITTFDPSKYERIEDMPAEARGYFIPIPKYLGGGFKPNAKFLQVGGSAFTNTTNVDNYPNVQSFLTRNEEFFNKNPDLAESIIGAYMDPLSWIEPYSTDPYDDRPADSEERENEIRIGILRLEQETKEAVIKLFNGEEGSIGSPEDLKVYFSRVKNLVKKDIKLEQEGQNLFSTNPNGIIGDLDENGEWAYFDSGYTNKDVANGTLIRFLLLLANKNKGVPKEYITDERFIDSLAKISLFTSLGNSVEGPWSREGAKRLSHEPYAFQGNNFQFFDKEDYLILSKEEKGKLMAESIISKATLLEEFVHAARKQKIEGRNSRGYYDFSICQGQNDILSAKITSGKDIEYISKNVNEEMGTFRGERGFDIYYDQNKAVRFTDGIVENEVLEDDLIPTLRNTNHQQLYRHSLVTKSTIKDYSVISFSYRHGHNADTYVSLVMNSNDKRLQDKAYVAELFK